MRSNLIKQTILMASLLSVSLMSLLAFASNDNHAWANDQVQRLHRIKKTDSYQQAETFAKNMKVKMQTHQFDQGVNWAKQTLVKPQPVLKTPKIRTNQKAKNGVNINDLIAQYSKMPTPSHLLRSHTHDLLIFVSFSMPKQSLEQWLNQSRLAGGDLVLRGLVGNSFRKTANRVRKLLGDQKGGFQIDPILFRQFHITKVPAVVVIQGPAPVCFNDKHCSPPPFDVIYGDIPLTRALEEIRDRGTVSNQKSQVLLTHLRAMQ